MSRETSPPKPETPAIPDGVIDRILDAPHLEIRWEIDLVRDLVAAVLEDLLRHSQKQPLVAKDSQKQVKKGKPQQAPKEGQKLIKLANAVLEYDRLSKHLFHDLYVPPPALATTWIRHLEDWLVDAERKRGRGRPKQTWEPQLFAEGMGLFEAVFGEHPTRTGGEDQRPGPTMAFMMELIASGREIAGQRGLKTEPWWEREEEAVKKQIEKQLNTEADRDVRTYGKRAGTFKEMLEERTPIPSNR